MKTIPINVYSNPTYRGCANGGVTEHNDTLYLACPSGAWEVPDDHPALVRLEQGAFGNPIIVPVNKPTCDEPLVGPMFGGSYAASSDSRFSRMIADLTGRPFYGAVPVHDRFETQAVYDALSR